jgi:hypothetical protein
LTDATAFAAVAAIDEANAATREHASAPATPAPAAPAAPRPEPAPPELPAAPSPAVDGRSSARAIGGSISASAVIADRVLPRLAPGVLVRGHVTGRRWAAGARAMLLPRQVLDVGTRGGRVAFVQWALGPELCFAQRWRVLELPICAFVELGQVRGRASGIERPGSAARLWAAVGSTFELRVRASKRFAVGLGFEAALPLAWSTFTVDGRAVHHVAPISARGLVGVELRWPW